MGSPDIIPAATSGFAAPGVHIEHRPDGEIRLRSTVPIGAIPRSGAHLLEEQAARNPDRPFMRQRLGGDGPWRQITYAEIARVTRNVAQWLIDAGHRPGDSIAILSGPSIEHVIMVMAAQRACVAAASLSVNLSLLGQPSEKLRACVGAVGARFAFVDDAERYWPAMKWLESHGVSFIVDGPLPRGGACVSLKTLCQTKAGPAVDERMAAITPATIARIMFTSGSTGVPKAAGLSQGNLMASVAQSQALGFIRTIPGEGPQVLDFMPYSHIFSGTAGLNSALRSGATIHLDAGKPTPQLFHQTVTNLSEVSPSWFSTAPIGYSMLVDAMEVNAALRRNFFRNLHYMSVSGATLPQRVRDRLKKMAVEETGRDIPMPSVYGATEIAASTFAHWDNADTSIIGLPGPCMEAKLVPFQGKYELRIRGPNVMARDGYVGNGAAGDPAFDEEGFFRTGDAAKLVDPNEPKAGLRFDGRFGEQFKLTSATYVAASTLRIELLAALEPFLREVCICGEGRDKVTAIGWLNEVGIFARFPHLSGLPYDALVASDEVRDAVAGKLRAFNDINFSSSRRIDRLMLANEALSSEHSEITDKGSINIRRIWERRGAYLERLYEPVPSHNVVVAAP